MVKYIKLPFLLIILSCSHESFNLQKQIYNGSLRLNGYYYSLENNYVVIFFLYNNGIIYKGGSGFVEKGSIINGKIQNINKNFYIDKN